MANVTNYKVDEELLTPGTVINSNKGFGPFNLISQEPVGYCSLYVDFTGELTADILASGYPEVDSFVQATVNGNHLAPFCNALPTGKYDFQIPLPFAPYVMLKLVPNGNVTINKIRFTIQ